MLAPSVIRVLIRGSRLRQIRVTCQVCSPGLVAPWLPGLNSPSVPALSHPWCFLQDYLGLQVGKGVVRGSEPYQTLPCALP